MVLGDSMADWLAYGLEQAYADSPEIGILRRHQHQFRPDPHRERNDPRGEYPDWPQAARELIAAQKPKFVLMMVGINDRRSIREAAPARNARTAHYRRRGRMIRRRSNSTSRRRTCAEKSRPTSRRGPSRARQPAEATPSPRRHPAIARFEFRTDAWSEAYIRRIDDTIAALKTSDVPVFWVGLPPLRGQKSAADISFLNDLYRSRADKAGIIYIDVWDGFVDEDGRYAQFGPDLEGQTRRLRSRRRRPFHHGRRPQARPLCRARSAALAFLRAPRWQLCRRRRSRRSRRPPAACGRAGSCRCRRGARGARPRPLSGPTVPLMTERPGDSEELLGGNAASGPLPMP